MTLVVKPVPLLTEILAAAVLLSACESPNERLPEYELAGQTMGTTYSVKLVAPDENIDRIDLGERLHEQLVSIDGSMSTYDQNSELSRFNAAESTDWIDVSAELCGVISSALDLSSRTDGAFDITVGPLVNLWGFGPEGAISVPPADDQITAARSRIGFEKVSTDCGLPAIKKDQTDIYVDLSAFAKGYAVDQSAELLEANDVANYLVEIGGELRVGGHNAAGKPWAIAVEKPLDNTREVQSVMNLTNSAVATSGDYRNFFEYDGNRYSHTIDPRSGRPVTHEGASVTVVSDSAADADALATALLVLGPDDGLKFAANQGIAANFLVRTDSGIEQQRTAGFSALVN